MIETGIPDATFRDLLDVKDYYLNGKSESEVKSHHANNVACIIKSIAPDAELYCARITGSTSSQISTDYIQAIEWLLDKQVNIINASCWIGYDGHNNYGNAAKWLDHIVIWEFVSIVIVAGNDRMNGITSGGMAYNVITVGAVDESGNRHPDSSYSTVFTGVTSKPDICSFGYDIYTEAGSISQTSAAAPQVTGAIALMCQQNSDLLLYPEAQKAIMAAGVNRDKDSQGNYIYPSFTTIPCDSTNNYYMYGAGILDCMRNYQIIRNNSFICDYYAPNSTGTHDLRIISLGINMTIRVALAYSRDVKYNDDETYTIKSLPDLEILMNSSSFLTTNAANNHRLNLKIASSTSTQGGLYDMDLLIQTTTNANIYHGIAWYID